MPPRPRLSLRPEPERYPAAPPPLPLPRTQHPAPIPSPHEPPQTQRQQRFLLLQVPPDVLEVRQALSKFTAAGSGVQFLHARVMVRGPGGAGKSATIEALAGKEFNASQMSTVGVGVDELELNHRELQLGRGDGVLKAYDRAAGEGEYVRAIAANAAAVLAGTATATGGSMLAKVEERGGVHPAKLRRDVAAAKEASPSSVSKEASPSSVSKLRAEVAKASSPAAASSSPAEASSSVPAKQAAASHP